MLCPKCGSTIADGVTFCTECGFRLADAGQTPPSQPQAPVQPQAPAQPQTPIQPQTPVPPQPNVPPQPPVGQPAQSYRPTSAPANGYFYQNGAPVTQRPGMSAGTPVTPVMNAQAGPLRAAVRGVLASPVVLLACLCLTVNLLGSLIGIIAPEFAMNMLLAPIMQSLTGLAEAGIDMDELMYALSNMNNGGTVSYVISAFFGAIPTLLVVIGAWLAHAEGRNRTAAPRTAGISILRGMKIFELVLLCISGVIILFVTLAGMLGGLAAASGGNSGAGAGVAIVGIISLLLVIGIYVFVIAFYVGVIRTCTVTRAALVTGALQPKKPSAFAAVIYILSAVGAVIGLIGFLPTFFGELPYLARMPFNYLIVLLVTLLQKIAQAILPILVAVIIFKLRGVMDATAAAVRQGYANPYQPYNR